MTMYLVTGPRAYHDVRPGRTFEANLDPGAERRAIARGSIKILDATPPGLVPGAYRPPHGWATRAHNGGANRRLPH